VTAKTTGAIPGKLADGLGSGAAGMSVAGNALSGDAEPAGNWFPAGSLDGGCCNVTCLRDGRILAVSREAFLYDSGAWTPTQSLPFDIPRGFESAYCLLNDGRFLYMGDSLGSISDPASDCGGWGHSTFMNVYQDNMPWVFTRCFAVATMMGNGQLLVMGREPDTGSTTAMYDGSHWWVTWPMTGLRRYHRPIAIGERCRHRCYYQRAGRDGSKLAGRSRAGYLGVRKESCSSAFRNAPFVGMETRFRRFLQDGQWRFATGQVVQPAPVFCELGGRLVTANATTPQCTAARRHPQSDARAIDTSWARSRVCRAGYCL
jgi:hypothetical protein